MLEKKWVTEMKNNFNGTIERINTTEERISKQKPREFFLADLYYKKC